MKTNKFVNFILEISQVLLVFLGVYSAIMCAALSLALPVNRLVSTLVILGVSFLFYGLFTVLETFHHGKLYGILGISAFVLIVIIRFRSVVQKGVVTIINTYLKEFISYTQSETALLSNKGFEQETASVEYCTTFVVILTAVYVTALISSCFYRKRRSSVYVMATVWFFVIPLTVGKIGYFSNVVTYLFVSVAVIGTRFLRFDTTDKRMRQKLSLVLLGVGVFAGGVTYLFLPPERYNNHLNDIVEVKNSALAFTTWEGEDVFTWMKEYFTGDILEYGKIGRKSQFSRTGKTLLKISGISNTNHGIYLKGYTGAEYAQSRWSQIKNEDGQYEADLNALSASGLSVDNWHVTLRNQIGDSQTTGNPGLWATETMTVKNLAFGFGNYVVPYYPTSAFSSEGGRSTVAVPGVQYDVEYFPILCTELKNGLIANQYKLADNDHWVNSQANRERLTSFAKKYYCNVPEETAGVIEEYKNYLNSQDGMFDKFNEGSVSLYQIIEETRNFIMKDTKFTLSPGKTPKNQDAVVYFLQENRKGYNSHYATAAAVLLRGIGVPTRYVEGLYVSKEKLADISALGTEIEVTDKDIHAWVEVYQENYGFVPMEFTPGMGDEDTDASSVMDDDSERGNGANGGGNQQDGGDDPQSEQSAPTPEPEDDMIFENIETEDYNREDQYGLETPDIESSRAELPEGTEEPPGQGKMPWWKIALAIFLGLLLAAVVVDVQRRIRILVFRNNMKKKTRRKQIMAYYRHMEKAFLHKGIRYRGQSVGEYTAQIAEAYNMRLDAVSLFISMVFQASFSYEKFSREQMAEFRMAYRTIRHEVYADVKGPKKLYYMYILGI